MLRRLDCEVVVCVRVEAVVEDVTVVGAVGSTGVLKASMKLDESSGDIGSLGSKESIILSKTFSGIESLLTGGGDFMMGVGLEEEEFMMMGLALKVTLSGKDGT